MLYHRDCGGSISIDITNIITWKSPSISIQPEGIKVGVTEIRSISELDTSRATFCCEKCGQKNLPLEKLDDFADIDCPVCGDKTPITELMVARNGLSLCPSCLKIAKGEKATKKERIIKVIKYFNLEGARLVFKPYSEMVTKKIIF